MTIQFARINSAILVQFADEDNHKSTPADAPKIWLLWAPRPRLVNMQ